MPCNIINLNHVRNLAMPTKASVPHILQQVIPSSSASQSKQPFMISHVVTLAVCGIHMALLRWSAMQECLGYPKFLLHISVAHHILVQPHLLYKQKRSDHNINNEAITRYIHRFASFVRSARPLTVLGSLASFGLLDVPALLD